MLFAAMLCSLAASAAASRSASRSSLAAVVRQQPLICAVTLQAALRCAAVKISTPAEDVRCADADVDTYAVQMLMLCARTVLCGGLFSNAFTGPDVVTAGESASMFSTQVAGLCATSIKSGSVCAATIWPADGASVAGIDSQEVDSDAAASGAAEAALAAARLACDAARNAAAVAAQQGEPVAAVWIALVARAGVHLGSSHWLAL
jgi:hypothetical protein